MTARITAFARKTLRRVIARRLHCVITGLWSADQFERWLDGVTVDGQFLPLSMRVQVLAALELLQLAFALKPGRSP